MNGSRICDLCDPRQHFAPVGNWDWPQGPAAGGVVEWLMAPVLKTGEVKASVGSNPTPSVFHPDRGRGLQEVLRLLQQGRWAEQQRSTH